MHGTSRLTIGPEGSPITSVAIFHNRRNFPGDVGTAPPLYPEYYGDGLYPSEAAYYSSPHDNNIQQLEPQFDSIGLLSATPQPTEKPVISLAALSEAYNKLPRQTVPQSPTKENGNQIESHGSEIQPQPKVKAKAGAKAPPNKRPSVVRKKTDFIPLESEQYEIIKPPPVDVLHPKKPLRRRAPPPIQQTSVAKKAVAKERPGSSGRRLSKKQIEAELEREDTHKGWRRRRRLLSEFESRVYYRYELPTVCKLIHSRIPELFLPPCLSTTPMYEFALSEG